jgi:hypothetical protein
MANYIVLISEISNIILKARNSIKHKQRNRPVFFKAQAPSNFITEFLVKLQRECS